MRKYSGLVLLAVFMACSAEATVWYVRVGATGLNNGSSWTNAFTSLQSGIAATTAGDSVWVANGTYKPTTTTSRTVSFVLPSGVKMFGGFAGTETSLAQRNYSTFQTILSGDIGQLGLHTDNSYHVVSANLVSNQTRLDGFKVLYGYANASTSGYSYGGGVYNTSGSLTVANCHFTENYAIGGGAFYHTGSGTVNILRNNFVNNTAGSGAGIGTSGSSVVGTILIQDCNISDNQVTGSGGGCDFYSGLITIDRCIISGNTAGNYCGAMYASVPTLTISNSLIVGNLADNYAVFYQDANNPNPVNIINTTIAHNKTTSIGFLSGLLDLETNNGLRNSIVWGNSSTIFSIYQPTITNCIVQGNYPMTAAVDTTDPAFVLPAIVAQAPFVASNFDYHLSAMSPAIDTGNNSNLPPLATLDLDGTARVFGPKADLGAYEKVYCSFTPTIAPAGPVHLCPGIPATLTASGGTAYRWYTGATTPAITVGTAGLKKVIALDGAGCRGVAQLAVTLSPGTLTIYSPPPATGLCPGTTKTLTAAGNALTSFSWNPGPALADNLISAPGKYVVTATTSDGCILKDSIEIVLLQVPQPVINFTGTALTTGNFTTYHWQLGGVDIPGATNQVYQPAVNGVYTVRVTYSTGCANVSPPFTVNNVSVTEPEKGAAIRIAPNPAQDRVTIYFLDQPSEKLMLSLRNATGQVVLRTEVMPSSTSNVAQLSLGNFPAGVYSLSISGKELNYTSRVVLSPR